MLCIFYHNKKVSFILFQFVSSFWDFVFLFLIMFYYIKHIFQSKSYQASFFHRDSSSFNAHLLHSVPLVPTDITIMLITLGFGLFYQFLFEDIRK